MATAFMEGAKRQIAKRAIFSFNSKVEDELEPTDWGNPHKEGFIYKAGGLNPAMKRRYLVLQDTNMFYFETNKTKDAKPLGSFSIEDATVEVEDKLALTFVINTSNRIWRMQCSSPEDMLSWVNAIQKCISRDLNFGGCSLKQTVQRALNRGSALPVPTVLRRCIGFLRVEERMRTEGIFRLSGDVKQVKSLKRILDIEEETTMLDICDTHAVASVLKSFLRELSEPILTWVLMDEWLSCADIPDQTHRVSEMQRISLSLPHFNRETMKFLMTFLKEISDLCMFNRMTISNLAVVFGPCLLPMPDVKDSVEEFNGDVFRHAEKQVTLTRDFITFHSLIFSPLPLDDPNAPQLSAPVPISQPRSVSADSGTSPVYCSGGSGSGSGPSAGTGSGSFKRPRAERFVRNGAAPVRGWVQAGRPTPAAAAVASTASSSTSATLTIVQESPQIEQSVPFGSSGSPGTAKHPLKTPPFPRASPPGVAKASPPSPKNPPAKRPSVPPNGAQIAPKAPSQHGAKKAPPLLPKPAALKGPGSAISSPPASRNGDNAKLSSNVPMRRRPMSILMQLPPSNPSPAAAALSQAVSSPPATPTPLQLDSTICKKTWPRLIRISIAEEELVSECLPISSDNICCEDSYLLDNESEIVLWHGVKSSEAKRIRALAVMSALSLSRKSLRVRSTVLEQGVHSDNVFFDRIGGRPSYIPDNISIDPDAATPSIFLLSVSTGTAQMTQLAVGDGRLRKSLLHPSEVYLIDLGFEIFIWIGRSSAVEDQQLVPIFVKEYIDSFNKYADTHVSVLASTSAETPLLNLLLS